MFTNTHQKCRTTSSHRQNLLTPYIGLLEDWYRSWNVDKTRVEATSDSVSSTHTESLKILFSLSFGWSHCVTLAHLTHRFMAIRTTTALRNLLLIDWNLTTSNSDLKNAGPLLPNRSSHYKAYAYCRSRHQFLFRASKAIAISPQRACRSKGKVIVSSVLHSSAAWGYAAHLLFQRLEQTEWVGKWVSKYISTSAYYRLFSDMKNG